MIRHTSGEMERLAAGTRMHEKVIAAAVRGVLVQDLQRPDDLGILFDERGKR